MTLTLETLGHGLSHGLYGLGDCPAGQVALSDGSCADDLLGALNAATPVTGANATPGGALPGSAALAPTEYYDSSGNLIAPALTSAGTYAGTYTVASPSG